MNGESMNVFTAGQFWAPLIEKALAKRLLGYGALTGGHCLDGFRCLTGQACEILQLQADTSAASLSGSQRSSSSSRDAEPEEVVSGCAGWVDVCLPATCLSARCLPHAWARTTPARLAGGRAVAMAFLPR
jgi:hypothetical protein